MLAGKLLSRRPARFSGVCRCPTGSQDDEFGLQVLRGAEAALKTMKIELAEKISFKRGATDFSSQMARMKAGGCEVVVLGTIIRETIGAVGESRKTGFNPTFLGSSASYTDLIQGRYQPQHQAFHQGHGQLEDRARQVRLVDRQLLVDGRWKVVSDDVKP